MHPAQLRISDFTYHLPNERIALTPAAQRDEAKLLVYKDGTITDSVFKNLPVLIPSHSLVVRNNSKVIRARLRLSKPTGGQVEIFLLEPAAGIQPAIALQQRKTVAYHCMVGGAAKWKTGTLLSASFDIHGIGSCNLTASLLQRQQNQFLIQFEWTPANLCFAEVVEAAGAIPLPPYIKRQATQEDAERYQTVYASEAGSVAAPTAGLHFTPAILQRLNEKEIVQAEVTLHVGAGTFLPVTADSMQHHTMHEELIEVTKGLLQYLVQTETVIAIGTTTMRTLESLYWLGLRILKTGDPGLDTPVGQWEPYTQGETLHLPSTQEALMALMNFLTERNEASLFCRTAILIAPGYRFRVCKALVTNFHQPGSTLLLLVAACLPANEWRRVYAHALAHHYRFLSYGDSSLLWLQP